MYVRTYEVTIVCMVALGVASQELCLITETRQLGAIQNIVSPRRIVGIYTYTGAG